MALVKVVPTTVKPRDAKNSRSWADAIAIVLLRPGGPGKGRPYSRDGSVCCQSVSSLQLSTYNLPCSWIHSCTLAFKMLAARTTSPVCGLRKLYHWVLALLFPRLVA